MKSEFNLSVNVTLNARNGIFETIITPRFRTKRNKELEELRRANNELKASYGAMETSMNKFKSLYEIELMKNRI
jgi:hypothetical protein